MLGAVAPNGGEAWVLKFSGVGYVSSNVIYSIFLTNFVRDIYVYFFEQYEQLTLNVRFT